MTGGRFKSYDPTIMEVFNDSLPLKGKLTILSMGETIPGFSNLITVPLTPQGNLVLPLKGDTKAVLSFHKGESKMKLDGYYYYGGYIGRLTLDKK
jgi:hypothetical protein